MKLEIKTKDPLNVLSSTKSIIENAEFISFNLQNINQLAQLIKQKTKEDLEDAVGNIRLIKNYEDKIQAMFIENVVNFCFWAEKGKEKWYIEWNGKIIKSGWYGLVMCFERALANKKPILNAEYLASISLDDVKKIFLGCNNIEIPLIEERMKNLRESGKILLDKYQGKFINLLETANYNAIEIVRLIYKDFSSFRDIFNFNGQEIVFLKRAQVCANDISYIYKRKNNKSLTNIDQLTAFADYKLPQILRMFDILKYNNQLAEKIDNYILIPSGSKEEIEIRSATIWGIELIRQKLSNYTAAQIDNAIWLMSQTLSDKTKPYHRTYSIYY